MPAETQLVPGPAQFSGGIGAGLWTFGHLDQIPRTTRVVLSILSYHAVAGGNPGTEISFYAARVGGAPAETILLGRGVAPEIVGPAGDADYTICRRVLPRDASGAHWFVTAISAGKDVDATATIDWHLEPLPDSSAEDSP